MKLDVLINYKEQSFDEEILKATNGEGVDVILDFVEVFVEVEVEKVNLLSIMSKRIQLIGNLLTPRSNEYKALLTKEFSENIIPYFEDRKIKSIIDTKFSLEDIGKAHLHMEGNNYIIRLKYKIWT